MNIEIIMFLLFAECASHCSVCYNETECYECTQGYFLTENAECQSEYPVAMKFVFKEDQIIG